MSEIRIQVEEGAGLTLDEMARDVTVTGWDGSDVLVRLREGQEQDLKIEETESGPVVSAPVPCEVFVPSNLPVTIRQALANLEAEGLVSLNAEQVHGNLRLVEIGKAAIAEVYGNLKVDTTTSLRLVGTIYGDAELNAVPAVDLQNVRGNLRAKGTDHLRVTRVGGNLQAKDVGGDLGADKVGGNAMLRDVAGIVNLDRVAGNLTAKNLTGGAKATRIGGNLVLNGELGRGRSYHFKADGNAMLRLAEGASAHLALSTKGNMMSSLALNDMQRNEKTLTGTLGDGGTEMVVEAKGNVMLGGGAPTFGADLGAEISRQVEESLSAIDLEAIGRHVSVEMEQALSRLRVKLEGVDWERFGLQAQQAVERAMDRMQRDMDRVAERAARHQERVERKAQQEARRMQRMERRLQRAAMSLQEREVEVDGSGWSARENDEPVEPERNLDEERLSILRMVEQGQISPEDAEMLLDALA
jgi:hypothetical protein